MKEIKQFIEMMESFKDTSISLETMCNYTEYKALKALADKPVSKMEITDEMVKAALIAYFPSIDKDELIAILANRSIYRDMKSSIEAVFDHIADDKWEKQDGWIECPDSKRPDLPEGSIIEVRLGKGLLSPLGARKLDSWVWGDTGFVDSNIVAYRIIPELEGKKAVKLTLTNVNMKWKLQGRKANKVSMD